MKLFIVGFPKSGTSSLHKAITSSGLSSAHWKVPKGYVGKLIYQDYFSGKDPLASLSDFDCVAQADVCISAGRVNFWPNLDFAVLGRILAFHPEITFLLNYRDPRKIADSMLRWNDLAKRICSVDVPGLPRGFGSSREELTSWIENHFHALRTFLPAERFREIDIANSGAREGLEDILGVPVRWWGTANANDRKKFPIS